MTPGVGFGGKLVQKKPVEVEEKRPVAKAPTAYSVLHVFQGGKRDGCTQLASDATTIPSGWTTFMVVHPETAGEICIKVLRPVDWAVKSNTPSYL